MEWNEIIAYTQHIDIGFNELLKIAIFLLYTFSTETSIFALIKSSIKPYRKKNYIFTYHHYSFFKRTFNGSYILYTLG